MPIKKFLIVIGATVLIGMAMWAGIIYVAAHFIKKFW
jgi:hypothetical protein